MRILTSIIFSLVFITSFGQITADIVIIGGTPGGITAAIAAAREGRTVAIFDRYSHLGGLPANGLGATDIATRGVTGGLFLDFVNRNLNYYRQTYGEGSKQVTDCSDGYHFEPSVGYSTLQSMINEYPKISVYIMHQFDANPENIIIEDKKISKIRILDRATKTHLWANAKVFIDATYEGDLMAAAGVKYVVGREAQAEYNEVGAGVVYKYWGGPEAEGTTHLADTMIQAYNYRLCLTNDSASRIAIHKPNGYNRSEYQSIVNDVWEGNHTDYRITKITPEQIAENAKRKEKGLPAYTPGLPSGISMVVNMVHLPNKKTDANNQHAAFLSTDLPVENYYWPTADWKWRDSFALRLKNYTLGLLYFIQTDTALPSVFLAKTRPYGLCATEYTDNQFFPRQVYVREGRRMKGRYFFTAKDCLPNSGSSTDRPKVHQSVVTSSHYAFDSHACRKREPNRVHLEGFVSYKNNPYTVPYEVMLPNEVDNLICPVPVSGSHIGFSTLRMEPCWMALGEAAGTAASLSVVNNKPLYQVDIKKMQEKLIDAGAVLVYFADVPSTDSLFKPLQRLALKLEFPTYNFEPNKAIDNETLLNWKKALGVGRTPKKIIIGKTTRAEALWALSKK